MAAVMSTIMASLRLVDKRQCRPGCRMAKWRPERCNGVSEVRTGPASPCKLPLPPVPLSNGMRCFNNPCGCSFYYASWRPNSEGLFPKRAILTGTGGRDTSRNIRKENLKSEPKWLLFIQRRVCLHGVPALFFTALPSFLKSCDNTKYYEN